MTQILSQNAVDDLDPLAGPLWTPEEVSKHLRVGEDTLRNWRRALVGPPVIMIAPHTPRYPENGLIIFKRDHATVAGARVPAMVTVPNPRGALAS